MLRKFLLRVLLLAAVAGCQTVPAPPPVVVVSNPTAAFVRYWEERLASNADARTWHQFCHAAESWRVLGKRDVRRLDAAMESWPPELRVVPDRWQPLSEPAQLPVWAFVRKLEVNEDEAVALSARLEHLDAVTHVEVHGPEALTALAETEALPSLTALRATKSDLQSLQSFVHQRGAALESLDVWENGLGDGVGTVLASRDWPRLQRLDVGANGLGLEAAQAVGDLHAPRLAVLVVSFNSFGDEGLRRALSGRSLTSLDARATTVGPAAIEALSQGGVSQLKSLDLSDNLLGDEGVVALAALPLAALRELRLNGVKMSATGSTALAAVIGGGLQVLELGRNDLGDSGVAPLCHPGVSGVRFLQLDATGMSSKGLRVISSCAPLNKLQSLSLHNNGAFDLEGAKLLSQAEFGSLTALGLDGCTLTDAALVELAAASWWPRITHLRLQGNQFTDSSVEAVFRSPPHRLQNLGLGWNELSGGATDALAAARLPHIRVLSLRGNPLDDNALRRLSEAPWLARLADLDLRSLAFDGLSLSLDAIAARMSDDAILRREQ